MQQIVSIDLSQTVKGKNNCCLFLALIFHVSNHLTITECIFHIFFSLSFSFLSHQCVTLALLLTNCDVKPAGKTHDDRAVGTGRGQGGNCTPLFWAKGWVEMSVKGVQ